MNIPSGIQLDPDSSYPNSWTPLVYLCACGKTVRADAELTHSAFAPKAISIAAKTYGTIRPDVSSLPGRNAARNGVLRADGPKRPKTP